MYTDISDKQILWKTFLCVHLYLCLTTLYEWFTYIGFDAWIVNPRFQPLILLWKICFRLKDSMGKIELKQDTTFHCMLHSARIIAAATFGDVHILSWVELAVWNPPVLNYLWNDITITELLVYLKCIPLALHNMSFVFWC